MSKDSHFEKYLARNSVGDHRKKKIHDRNTKFWKGAFLATTLIVSNPLHASIGQAGVGSSGALWKLESSSAALGMFMDQSAAHARTAF